jgi:hypothetical protein
MTNSANFVAVSGVFDLRDRRYPVNPGQSRSIPAIGSLKLPL